MATAERREARRRKLLRNPEDRLQKILGSRSTHPNSHSKLEQDENASKSTCNSAKNDDVHGEKEVVGMDLKGREEIENVLKLEEQKTKIELTKGVCESKDLEAEGDVETRHSPLENESAHRSAFKHSPKDASTSLPKSTVNSVLCANQTDEHESSRSASKRWRVIFNVVLAFVLVSKWSYVNLEVLLSTDDKEGSGPGNSHKHLVHSESFIWPFLALQLFFVCVTSFQKTSHSTFISMLTVALQLCGIPIQFTYKINFVLTALLAALKDFVVFFFSSIVIHHVVEHCINSEVLKQVLGNLSKSA